MPYLLKRFSVRNEFSAGLVLQKKREAQPTKISSVMVCAPVTFPVRDKLNDLPGTETEVNTIANLFSEKNIASKVYLRTQANEAAIKSNSLKDYSLIHFATHGIVDEDSPELSRIYLQSDSKTAEDGNLFAGEIYNLEFNASLVSLSACQTGLGDIANGEGVYGLQRAFLVAGAKVLIMSMFKVDDEATQKLILNFYRKWITTNNLRQSFVNAKKELRLDYPEPYYWGTFMMIGLMLLR